jgi:hypothetical protein
MITLTTAQTIILEQTGVESFYIIKISGPFFTKRISSYFRDITVSTGEVYTGNSEILSIQTPQISTTVDREQYTVVLGDSNFEYAALAEDSFVGALFEVRLVLVDPATDLPLTNLSETIILYRGQVDSVSIKSDLSEIGENTFSIVGASPLASLDASKPFYTSKSFIREKVLTTDSCFDQVYQGSGKIRLRWGKI